MLNKHRQVIFKNPQKTPQLLKMHKYVYLKWFHNSLTSCICDKCVKSQYFSSSGNLRGDTGHPIFPLLPLHIHIHPYIYSVVMEIKIILLAFLKEERAFIQHLLSKISLATH